MKRKGRGGGRRQLLCEDLGQCAMHSASAHEEVGVGVGRMEIHSVKCRLPSEGEKKRKKKSETEKVNNTRW